MSTLRISNIEAKADNSSPTVDEQLKITNSTGDLMLYLDGRTSGITTVGINTTNQTIKFDANNNIMVTGIVTATEFHGTLAVGTSVTYGDNEKAYFGNGLDMSLYHDGTNSNIANTTNDLNITNTGDDIIITANDDINLKTNAGDNAVNILGGAAVELYHNASKKFQTTSSGVTVTGTVVASGAATLGNGSGLNWGDTSARIRGESGSSGLLRFDTNGGERLRITSGGKLGISHGSPSTIIHVVGNSTVGTSVTMTLQTHDTANATAGINLLARDNSNNNETCKIQAASGGQETVDLQFHTNNTEKLRITSAGLVGINQTAPAVELDIKASTPEIRLTCSNAALGQGETIGQLGWYTTDTTTPTGAGTVSYINTYSATSNGSDYTTAFSNRAGAGGGETKITLGNALGQIRFYTHASAGGTERLRIDSGGKVSIGDAATHTFSAHSEGDDLVIGGAGWRGMTIYGEGGGGVIQFADNGDNRVGQILYYHAENSMSFRVNGNVTRLKINSDGDVCIGNSGNPPWTETGGNYNNISLCGNDASSSGFLNLGNGAAATNADFDLSRIKFHNGATEVATIRATTATSDSGDAHLRFFTKKAGAGSKEVLRIRNDGFVETMYDQNTGSYSVSGSPTPRLRIRNDYGGDGIISSAQFFAKRGSGAASIFDIGVITTSTDYESNLIISSRDSSSAYSEKIRIESAGQIRMNYGNNAKQAYALRSTFRTITGHSSTGYQYVRCALMAARTAYRVCVNTAGGNYGPGAQFFTVLRNWDNTTFYVSDKFNMGSAYANGVRMQSDNGGDTWYMEISINLTTTSQGFGLSVIPIGNNAGVNTTNLQFYGSGMSNLTYTSSTQSL